MADGLSLDDLVQSAHATATAVDRLGQRFAGELATVLRSVERRLTPLVTTAAEGSRTSIIRAAQANRTRKALEGLLDDSGYPELATSAYGSRLDVMTERVLASRRLAQQAARLSGAFDLRVESLKALHVIDLFDEGDDVSRMLWQRVTHGVFGSQSVDSLLADLHEQLDASEAHISTVYDTSVSMFGRQVEALQAGDDPDTPFLYAGPADKKNREFCRARVGKVFTRAQIDAFDNGQPSLAGPPFLVLGGWNCRHQAIEVSKFSELNGYVGTEQRVPEIAAQLDRAA